MSRHVQLRFALAMCFAWAPVQAAAADPATTYKNPVLTKGSPADPHVLRVDDTYYLYPTTHTRGFDAYVSDDLIHWENKGSVFDDPRGGAWAPDVFHHRRGDGKFYLYYTDNDPDPLPGPHEKQIGVAVADGPLGPFVDQAVLFRGSIDAHMYQDDDGQLYLYYVNIADGFRILVQRMSDPLTKQGKPIEALHPTEPWEMVSGHVTEGPWMLKRDGVYYLMYSGTGADSPNYGIGYATAKSPLGPFKKYAGNPIAQRTDAIYGPGHHSVVTGPDGKLWMVYHQKRDEQQGWSRFVALDPVWFDEQGVLHAKVTKATEQPGPAAAE